MTILGVGNTKRRRSAEAGVALLISLFALMLICVIGVALLMATGTDTALTGNYRSAASVYYAARAGLEEARTRLLPNAPNNSNLDTIFGLQSGALPTPGQVWYITNPLPAEVVTPWDTTSVYADNEFRQEFGVNPPTASPALLWTPSVSAQAGLPGPIFKWVRINVITSASEQAGANIAVGGGGLPSSPLIYANGTLSSDPATQAVQALEITALAAMPMPNGTLSERMLQYVVAPTTLFNASNMIFPAALTLDGNNVNFTGPVTPFAINGIDSQIVGNCLPGAPQAAIGYTSTQLGDLSYQDITTYVPATSGIPTANQGNYSGAGGGIPNVSLVAISSSWQVPSGLQSLALTVGQNADIPIVNSTPYNSTTATGTIFPVNMSAVNPMTIVVNGDLDLSSWSGTGYGILYVSGELTLNANANWNGVVLVIGKGLVDATAGVGQINGAVLLAQAFDKNNDWALLPDVPGLGAAWWRQTGGSGNINYSSCWINAVQKVVSYKILSFREISLN
jgi:hypothetical protein